MLLRQQRNHIGIRVLRRMTIHRVIVRAGPATRATAAHSHSQFVFLKEWLTARPRYPFLVLERQLIDGRRIGAVLLKNSSLYDAGTVLFRHRHRLARQSAANCSRVMPSRFMRNKHSAIVSREL